MKLLLVVTVNLCLGQATDGSRSLARYAQALEIHHRHGETSCAEVLVQAHASKLGRSATLRAMRQKSRGATSYLNIAMDGDQRVLRAVIAPYVTTSMAGRIDGDPFSLLPSDYEFHYTHTENGKERAADVFDVRPHENRVGRFTGRLWLDSATGLPLKISGRFTQPPSGSFRRVSMDREYSFKAADSAPVSHSLQIETASIGPASVVVTFTTNRSCGR